MCEVVLYSCVEFQQSLNSTHLLIYSKKICLRKFPLPWLEGMAAQGAAIVDSARVGASA
jgi:hypothetical protein